MKQKKLVNELINNDMSECDAGAQWCILRGRENAASTPQRFDT